MHWEPHEFALPKLPKGMKWHLAFNTDDRERNGIYEEGEEPCLEQQKQFLVPARTIVVFIGLKERAEENRGEKRGKKESSRQIRKRKGQRRTRRRRPKKRTEKRNPRKRPLRKDRSRAESKA